MLRTTALAASFSLMTGLAQAETLTVYTAGPGGLADALAEAFQADTGISVELFQATTGRPMSSSRQAGDLQRTCTSVAC